MKHVLQVAADSAGYGQALPENEAVGLAFQYSFASYMAWAVRVRVDNGAWSVVQADGALDAGTIVNRDRVLAQIEGNFVFGLTMAQGGNLTVTNGVVDQSNFTDYPLARMSDIPPINCHIVDSEMIPGGVGEPGLPPVMPAIANAILQISGTPVREIPIRVG
jgi:isoquinoline 1-oxidoreductase beta subunit